MNNIDLLYQHLKPSPQLPSINFTVGEQHTHRHPVRDAHRRRIAMIKHDADSNMAGGTFGTGPGAPGPQYTGASAGGSSITVSWQTPVPGAQTYNIYRGTTSGGETSLTTGRTVSPYVDSSGLSHGATYYYQVTAVISGVETQKSPEISVLFP